MYVVSDVVSECPTAYSAKQKNVSCTAMSLEYNHSNLCPALNTVFHIPYIIDHIASQKRYQVLRSSTRYLVAGSMY